MAANREFPFGLQSFGMSHQRAAGWVGHEHSFTWGLRAFEGESQGALNDISDLLEQLPMVIGDRMEQALRLRTFEEDLQHLSDRLGRLEASDRASSCGATIQTFAPEPYRLTTPIYVTIDPLLDSDGFMASFFDANISTTGDNQQEAFENLKSMILDMFDSLTAEKPENLGPEPLRQLAVLREFIRPQQDR